MSRAKRRVLETVLSELDFVILREALRRYRDGMRMGLCEPNLLPEQVSGGEAAIAIANRLLAFFPDVPPLVCTCGACKPRLGSAVRLNGATAPPGFKCH